MAGLATDSSQRSDASPMEWSSARRGAVAAAVLGVLVAASATSLHGNMVALLAVNVPLLALYVFGFRSSVSSSVAAVGLAAIAGWAWWAGSTYEYADQRAFVPLTHLVVSVAVLASSAIISAVVGALRSRRR